MKPLFTLIVGLMLAGGVRADLPDGSDKLELLRFRVMLVDSIIREEFRVARRTGETKELFKYLGRRAELTLELAKSRLNE